MKKIEDELFKKSTIVYDKLIPYGFQKHEHRYILSQYICDDAFRIDVEIIEPDGIIEGHIYDVSFHEEYHNYRIESQTGEFVQKIRKAFIDLLTDIKHNCTTTDCFVTDQANRITNLIRQQYHDEPEFIWVKFPGYGIFRNSDNDKWYGLIMNITKDKIDQGKEEVEILNVKLAENKINDLLHRKGFYKAYHMKKDKWITILLDDTIPDAEIMRYLKESHAFTEQNKEWIVPANPNYYDVIHCFRDTDTILWKQSNHIHIGDIVYLYVGKPYSSILYQCEVLEVNIPYEYEDKNLAMKKAMKLKLQRTFGKDAFPFDKLKKYGVTSIRGPRSMPNELSTDIRSQQ